MKTYKNFTILMLILIGGVFVGSAKAGPPPPFPTITSPADGSIMFCGVQYTVTATGGYGTLTWSGPGTFSPTTGYSPLWTAPTTAGNATITVTDGISRSDSVNVTVQKQILVDKDATGSNNGTTWANAFTSLQSALDKATSYNEIWVTDGAYKPSLKSSSEERSKTYQLVDGVTIYGGFAGTESSKNQRNWNTNETILSGDIDNDGVLDNDNAWHVVTGFDNTGIDGFTVKLGYANASSPDNKGGGMFNNYEAPTVENCKFISNYSSDSGGGMYCNESDNQQIKNCRFIDNKSAASSSGGGGGLYVYDSNTHAVVSCEFVNNTADANGGGLLVRNSPTHNVTNCSFTLNRAKKGGAIAFDVPADKTQTITNSIFWADSASSGNGWEIYCLNNSEHRTTICYSDIAGGITGSKVYPEGEISNCSDRAYEPMFSAPGPDMTDVTNGAGFINYVDVAVGTNYAVGDVIEYNRDGTARTVTKIDDTKVYFLPVMGASSASGKILYKWDTQPDFTDTTESSGSPDYIYTYEYEQYEVGDIIVYDNDGVGREVTSCNSEYVCFTPSLSSSSQSDKNVENYGKPSNDSLDFGVNADLTCSSQLIDWGNGDKAPSTDILGRSRINSTCQSHTGGGTPNYTDIGAYERQN